MKCTNHSKFLVSHKAFRKEDVQAELPRYSALFTFFQDTAMTQDLWCLLTLKAFCCRFSQREENVTHDSRAAYSWFCNDVKDLVNIIFQVFLYKPKEKSLCWCIMNNYKKNPHWEEYVGLYSWPPPLKMPVARLSLDFILSERQIQIQYTDQESQSS